MKMKHQEHTFSRVLIWVRNDCRCKISNTAKEINPSSDVLLDFMGPCLDFSNNEFKILSQDILGFIRLKYLYLILNHSLSSETKVTIHLHSY
jgi:hypothetical protein